MPADRGIRLCGSRSGGHRRRGRIGRRRAGARAGGFSKAEGHRFGHPGIRPRVRCDGRRHRGGQQRRQCGEPRYGLAVAARDVRRAGAGGTPVDETAALAALDRESSPLNTTIAVAATDAALSSAGCRRLAMSAQDGLARAIRPAHTPPDGDTVFALATGARTVEPTAATPAAMSPERRYSPRWGLRPPTASPALWWWGARCGPSCGYTDLPRDAAGRVRVGTLTEMSQPHGIKPPSPGQPEKPAAWKVGGATILSFVALLYLVEIADQISGHALDRNGIRPLQADGLSGILFAPLLHANWAHLFANTVPALVLGFVVTLAGLGRFLGATAIIWIVGGFGTWLIGGIGGCSLPTNHIGASGLIFGWLTFLLIFGWFVRRFWQIVVGVIVAIGYGSVLWGAAGAGSLRRGVLAGAPVRCACRSAGGLPAFRPRARGPRAQESRPARRIRMSDRFAPVGIFDSGVGGLTVARSIIDQLPDEDIIYVGDTANGSYGPLSISEVRAHALRIGDDLVDRGVKALVIACNTASSACLRDARERYDVPVVG